MVNVDVDGDFSFDLCFESGTSPLACGCTRKVPPLIQNTSKSTRSDSWSIRPSDLAAVHHSSQDGADARRKDFLVAANPVEDCPANKVMKDIVRSKLRLTAEIPHKSHHRLLIVAHDCCKDRGMTVICAEEDCEFSFDMCFECAAYEAVDTNLSKSSKTKAAEPNDTAFSDQHQSANSKF